MSTLKKLAIITASAVFLAQLEVAIFPFRAARPIYDVLLWTGIFAVPVACCWAVTAIRNATRPVASFLAIFCITCASSLAVLFFAVESGALTLWLWGNWSLKFVA